MAYRTRILPLARTQIGRWQLPDEVLVEVYLRLDDVLPSAPHTHLIPTGDDDGGMLYYFEMIDPRNRFCRHSFAFRVFYGTDEETVFIASGVYRKDIEA